MSKLNPDEKRGGYSGSKAKDEVTAPQSQGATVTPSAAATGTTETSASEKDAA